MKVLLAQINPTIGNIAGNTAKILQAIEKAQTLKLDMVLFPEMCLSGYPPEDFLLLPNFIEEIEQALSKVISAASQITAIVGLPRRNPLQYEKGLLNSAAIIHDGKLLGYQDKILLPTYDVFDERRYFEPGPSSQVWKIGSKRVAITICEDIWQHAGFLTESSYRRDPVIELVPEGPELLLNLSASPYSPSKFEMRKKICQRVAQTLHSPVLLCNQVGGNDSLVFDGYSLYVDERGALVDFANGFVEEYLVVDLAQSKAVSKEHPQRVEDLYHALVLGLRDYFFKSGFSKACLGISGGIDSAVVACLAVEALGKENVLGVMMPSRFSSQETFDDAQQLIHNLGIPSKEISIEGPFEEYLNLLKPHFENRPFDITEENMQARIRGMLLMALSNKFGYIVLSTGNKSELAMGYSTLYGDMCGGLAVISDVTKQQVYALAKWINRSREIIPLNSIQKAPTAELRHGQKDSDSLPDYAIVDQVLQAYVEEHRSPKEIAQQFSLPLSLVEELVARIHRNEYKRRQAPPGLRISEKAFTVGRRFPIVQKFV